MIILAVNFSHDGSGVIVGDGAILGYVNTERFSRIKKHPGLREQDLDELLGQAGIGIHEVDVVILENFILNCPEIEETYGTNFQDTWFHFTLNESRDRIQIRGREIACLANLDHFLCHSAASYYFSPFESAVCFSYDPLGSGAYLGMGNRLLPIPFSEIRAGQLFNEVSIRVGFGGIFGAGKTMGLAPYGVHELGQFEAELAAWGKSGIRRGDLCRILERIWEWSETRQQTGNASDGEWNAAAAYLVQDVLERVLRHVLNTLFSINARNRMAGKLSVQPNLCLSGGAALNSVANQKCFSGTGFSRLYLHPACGDDGTAIGAALYYWHHVLGNPKAEHSTREAMYGVRSYDTGVKTAVERHPGKVVLRCSDDYLAETAKLLAAGKIVGWFQGASEIGPRSLGNRSILCDPSRPEMKAILNGKVKFREAFRPFAPSVLNEHAREWFGLDDSPFMLRVAKVLKPGVPAITHYDRTARIQTVRAGDNPAYYALINEFRRLTGIPMLLNTSFNIKGEPIVETPDDAIASFLNSGLDNLVFPGCIVSKPA